MLTRRWFDRGYPCHLQEIHVWKLPKQQCGGRENLEKNVSKNGPKSCDHSDVLCAVKCKKVVVQLQSAMRVCDSDGPVIRLAKKFGSDCQ